MSIEDNRHLSDFVPGRLPEFVRVSHPTLVAFLSAYYEWLDQRRERGYLLSPMAMRDVTDVDRTMGQFIDKFKSEYLFQFPESLAISQRSGLPVDERNLIKNIKQFYRAKGTEKAYEFLFRILYDTGVEFYYPKKDILRLSSGKWVQNNYLRVSNSLGDQIYRAAGNNIVQKNASGQVVATARVVSATIYQKGNFTVAELLITGRNGTFRTGSDSEFEFSDGGETLKETKIYSVVSSVTIQNGGDSYLVGDRVNFTTATGDSGQRAYGTVTEVDSSGSIRNIKIEDFGINYDVVPTISIETVNGSGFSGTAVIGSLCKEQGYYANNDGRLSTNKVIQDNHFFQNWSYVLRAEVVIDNYRETIRRLVHPSGTGMFGSVLVKRCARSELDNAVRLDQYEVPYIGNYMPYTFRTYDNLSDWFGETGGYNPNYHDRTIINGSFSTQGEQEIVPGNPISNGVPFLPVPFTDGIEPLGSTGASGYTGAAYTRPLAGEPYWFIYKHPNTVWDTSSGLGAQSTVAKVWSDQARGECDFIAWDEWALRANESAATEWLDSLRTVGENRNPASCCVGMDGALVPVPAGFTGTVRWRSHDSFKYAVLLYNKTSEFRKMTVRSFFEMPVPGSYFDCRGSQNDSEKTYNSEYGSGSGGVTIKLPSVSITNPKVGLAYSVESAEADQDQGSLLVKYQLVDPQYIRQPIRGISFRIDNGTRLIDNQFYGSFVVPNVPFGSHTLTAEFVDGRGNSIDFMSGQRISVRFRFLPRYEGQENGGTITTEPEGSSSDTTEGNQAL